MNGDLRFGEDLAQFTHVRFEHQSISKSVVQLPDHCGRQDDAVGGRFRAGEGRERRARRVSRPASR